MNSLLDRTQAPAFQLSTDYSLSRPEIIKLSNGVELFAFRGLQQEVVKLDLLFEAGKWYEPSLGVSHFTSQMLSKGTEKRNSFQFAEAMDSLGAHLEISPGFDVITLSLFALRKNLLASLELVNELLEKPAFDKGELRLMRDITSQGLKINNEKTSVVASKEFRKVIFGKDHPYGSAMEEDDIKKIEQESLIRFFRDRFSLHSMFLVGRLSDDEITSVIKAIPTSMLEARKRNKFERIPSRAGNSKFPESIQASIRLGKKCLPKANSADYFNAVMFNHVLGGFFGSRLMKNIREEKGLTYGIYSTLHHFLRDGFWMIGAEVNKQNAEQAIDEIKREIRALQNEPMSLSELEIAKNYFIGSWQSENSTLFSVADKIKGLHLWDLPDNYYTNLMQHIQKITPTQIQAIANSHFDISDWVEVQI